MNVNLKEKIAQIYARKGTREAPARWRIPLLFLALLIPAVAGQLAAAEEPASGNYVLVIDVYSEPSLLMLRRRRSFGSGLRVLRRARSQTGSGFPRSSNHHVLPEKDFDLAEQGDAMDRSCPRSCEPPGGRQAENGLLRARVPAGLFRARLSLRSGQANAGSCAFRPSPRHPMARGNLESAAVI